MFIGYYELENEQYNNIYYKNKLGYKLWKEDTFNPNTKNISLLDLTIKGKTYKERKYFAEEIAKIWQNEFLGFFIEESLGDCFISHCSILGSNVYTLIHVKISLTNYYHQKGTT